MYVQWVSKFEKQIKRVDARHQGDEKLNENIGYKPLIIVKIFTMYTVMPVQ